jgi:CDP-ribitol ribitolphosphotransferase
LVERKKIVLFKTSSSGCNSYFLYKNLPSDLAQKYDVQLAELNDLNSTAIKESDIFITTHGEFPSSPNKINIELWHGFPLKAMANMDPSEQASSQAISNYWRHVDLIISYSPLYITLFNSCMGARIDQYRVTGVPRNDALFDTGSRKRLEKLFPGLRDKKTMFFLPTFRKSIMTPTKLEGNKNQSNVFGFESFDLPCFVTFLKSSGIGAVIKLHPFEEQYFIPQMEKWKHHGVYLLTDSMLRQSRIDLYEILGACDLLITDYSSVYFDYLLLNRPIIFTPTDLDAYRSTRGLLLHPYEFWTPGPKAFNQESLQLAISQSFEDHMAYDSERRTIREMAHSHQDDQSAARIWTEIDLYVEQREQAQNAQRLQRLEMEKLQSSIKAEIKTMIESGQLIQAKTTLAEFEKSSQPDGDLFSIKSVIYLMEGRAEEAIQLLIAGHRHFPNHQDILHNLAFAYESLGQSSLAVHYYQLLSSFCKDTELLGSVNERLKALNAPTNGGQI